MVSVCVSYTICHGNVEVKKYFNQHITWLFEKKNACASDLAVDYRKFFLWSQHCKNAKTSGGTPQSVIV